MNTIYLTGDKHGSLSMYQYDIKKVTGYEPDSSDYLIILGDFGLLWEYKKNSDEYRLVDGLSKFPYKILFLDGNHENHPRLGMLKKVKMFGGTVGKYNDHIYHLRRGELYNIHGNNIFTMGGAASIDREWRTEHIDWWATEVPNNEEMNYGITNLCDNDRVDYILGHTGPNHILREFLIDRCQEPELINCSASKFFDYIVDDEFGLEFKKMYFGHMHGDWISSDKKYHILYNTIIKLGK